MDEEAREGHVINAVAGLPIPNDLRPSCRAGTACALTATAVLPGAGRPEAHPQQAEEAVPGEDGRAGARQPPGGAARRGGEEAAPAGGGAEEGVGPG